MTDATDYDPVECPAGDCTYRDAVRSVAAHVSRADDDAHSWDRLDYDGARDFVMTEKRRQRRDDDGDSASDGNRGGFETAADLSADESPAGDATDSSAATDATDSPASGGADDTNASADDPDDDFELGFEREALVLLALADEYDLSSLDDLGTFQLADLYTLLADLKNAAEDARAEVRDALLEQVREDRTVTANLGSVDRRTYEYRQVRDEATVRDALADADVDPEAVRSFDKSKLRDAVEETGLDEDDVFDVEERAQIRISDADDDRRRERFERLDSEVRSLVDEE